MGAQSGVISPFVNRIGGLGGNAAFFKGAPQLLPNGQPGAIQGQVQGQGRGSTDPTFPFIPQLNPFLPNGGSFQNPNNTGMFGFPVQFDPLGFPPGFTGFSNLEDTVQLTPYGATITPGLLNQEGFNKFLGFASGGVLGGQE